MIHILHRAGNALDLSLIVFYYLIAFGVLFALGTLAARRDRPGHEARREIAFLALIVLALAACRWPVFIYPHQLNPDESGLAADAIKTTRDMAPWRGFDAGTSGPLNGYVLALPALFGAAITFASSRIVGFVLITGTMLSLYFAVKWIYNAQVARLAILPVLLLLALTVDPDFLHCSSEHLPILLTTIPLAATAYLASGRGTPRHRAGMAALAGFCISNAVFAKLQALPIAFAVFLIAAATLVFARRSQPEWKRVVAAFAVTLFAVPMVFLAVVRITGEWRDARISYIKSSFAYLNGQYFPGGLQTIGPQFFFRTSDIYPFFLTSSIVVVLVGVIIVARSGHVTRRSGWASAASVLLLAAAVYAIHKPHRPYGHYLLLSLVPVTCCVANSVGLIGSSGLWRKRESLIRVTFLALFALPIFAVTTVTANDFVAKIVYHWTWSPAEPITSLRRYTKPGDMMSVWGWTSEYYVRTGTIMATRDAETSRQTYPNPYRDYFRSRFMRDLKASKPFVFVDAVGPYAFLLNDRPSQGHETFPALAQYIREHYELKDEVAGVRIYLANGQ